MHYYADKSHLQLIVLEFLKLLPLAETFNKFTK